MWYPGGGYWVVGYLGTWWWGTWWWYRVGTMVGYPGWGFVLILSNSGLGGRTGLCRQLKLPGQSLQVDQ